MYTQCPECGVAFRVTAEVLKQAAGQVRCGGCGTAFNALEHLSEEKPHAPERRQTESKVPELAPDEPIELEPDEAPKTMSAEQSAALLKTLDELAGDDIRIEDTGVEWRVISDEDEAAESDDAAPPVRDLRDEPEPDLIADTGSLKFIITDEDAGEPELDEVLEASPTPVDQFLTDTPPQVDAPEIFDEMRFDDNTPLPDDFDVAPPPPAPEPVAEAPEPVEVAEDPQVDLELGDPDDWEDLLDEVAEPAGEAAVVANTEAEVEEDAAVVADDLTTVADGTGDQPLDVDTQFALQAEAMGIDLSGLHKKVDVEDAGSAPEEDRAVDAAADTTIDEDLIAAAFETEATAREQQQLEVEAKSEETGIAVGAEQEDEEFHPAEFGIAYDFDDELEPSSIIEELESAEADEGQELAEPDEELELAGIEDEPETLEADLEAELPVELDETEPADAELLDEFREEPADEQSLKIRLDDDDDVEHRREADSGEHHVPEMTEEEKTINMLIDQDLFSIAVEDEEGFASTIVQPQPDRKVEAEIESKREDTDEPVELELEAEPEAEIEADAEAEIEAGASGRLVKLKSKIPLVETIIMEGESIRGEEDDEKSKKNRRLGAALKARQAEEDLLKSKPAGSSRIGLIAAAVLLALVLVLQFVHQSREALATIPAFNKAVGPVYRMLGKPLTPAWDIKGWRFEATKGSTDEGDEVLTIYSRVGNQSDAALPYPLVHVSLTDRFEDIIGSRVLEPGEYLGSNADPRELVPAGNTFNAVISIESPAAEATGFKLNVCYRLAGGQLRCAVEDFK